MPYNWRDERDAAVARIAKNEDFVPRIYYDSRGIPTVGYGSSLTNKDKKPWRTLGDTLGALGVDSGKHERIINEIREPANPGRIEPWRRDGKYQNAPPFDVLVEEPKARAVMANHVDQDEAALRQQLGRDASGVSNWEKLEPKMRSALLDARYNTPDLINTGITDVLQHQEDPAWRDKAWWEMAVNVKDQNARRLEEANSFTTNSMLKSPVNSGDYWKSVLDQVDGQLKEGMAPPKRVGVPVAQGAAVAPSTPFADFTSVAWRPQSPEESGNLLNSVLPRVPEPEVRLWNRETDAGPTPGNLLNANALPENLLNMPDYERRKWGVR